MSERKLDTAHQKKAGPLTWILQILPWLRPYRAVLALMIGLGALSSLADILYPLFNSYALDHFIAGGTLQGLGRFVALYLLLMVLQEIDNFYCLYHCGKIEMSVDRDLRNAAFGHLQTLSFSYFNQNSVGSLHSRVMSDTEKIGELVAWRMMDLVWNFSYVVFVLGSMLVLDARLALYIIALIPVAVALTIFFQKRLLVWNRKIREINAKITGNFNEGISGARSIRTLVIEKLVVREFRQDTAQMARVSTKNGRDNALFTSTLTLLSSAALAIVLWRGGRITREGVMQIGTLSVFMSYAVGLLEPIQNIVTTLTNLVTIQANIERFLSLMREESDVADTPEVIARYGDNFSPKRENWEELEGEVEFKDVTFRYPDGEENVLEHFHLRVPRGSTVAIVGETGAGKSTLVNLVCRFYEPTQGQVLIDGRDARERSQLWLHAHIGYVLQQPFLFSGSIRDNLRYGRPDADDGQILEALRLVHADGIVRRLPRGLDSEVGEGGDQLSTGEKQLLSFARALLADPRILVLDEATSSIDTVTERAIQEAIRTIVRGRTSFVIAHRLSTIVGSDLILAVRDGRILERGTHEELMRRKGYYYELFTRSGVSGSIGGPQGD